MKLKIASLTLLFLCFAVQVASAQWSALNSGYAVTTNYHGKEVPLGAVVTAIAGTTDPAVKNVTFKWKYPNGTVAFIDENIPVESNGTRWPDSSGDLIYYAKSQYRADTYGDWGVQAFFIGEDGKTKADVEHTIKIRATSFNVIPIAPVVGTAGVIIAMTLGFGVFLKRRRPKHFSA